MDKTRKRLLDSVREILATPDLTPEGTAGSPGETLADLGEAEELTRLMYRVPCPAAMRPGFVLPHVVSVRWEHDRDVSGEMRIRNLFGAMHAKLKIDLPDWTLDGHRLSDMRIADAVLVQAGPLHVVFEVTGEPASPTSGQLFVFDSRDLCAIELPYDAYLEMAAATRGIIFWQYLFCDERVSEEEARVLSAELAFLESRFPAPELPDLRRRLRERSD